MKLTLPKSPRWMRQVGWRTVVGAVLLAGIVHITATLAVPLLGPGNAFRKLRETLPANQMVFLPPPTPNTQLLPFVAADALYAACRFDLTSTPVAVSALLSDPGWTLSLHTPQGDNFYVMPAQQLRRSEVMFVITPASERLVDFGSSRRCHGRRLADRVARHRGARAGARAAARAVLAGGDGSQAAPRQLHAGSAEAVGGRSHLQRLQRWVPDIRVPRIPG